MGIKQEAGSSKISDEKVDESGATTEKFAQEKQKLLEAFASLKAENQKMAYDLKRTHDENVKLSADKHRLEQKIEAAEAKVIELDSTLSQMKINHSARMLECEQKICDLLQQNKLLTARIKQLRTGIEQADHEEGVADESNENVYEVEKLINDKIKRDGRYFLVRWKGYTSKYDTWERESNLNCPGILKKYLQANKKN